MTRITNKSSSQSQALPCPCNPQPFNHHQLPSLPLLKFTTQSPPFQSSTTSRCTASISQSSPTHPHSPNSPNSQPRPCLLHDTHHPKLQSNHGNHHHKTSPARAFTHSSRKSNHSAPATSITPKQNPSHHRHHHNQSSHQPVAPSSSAAKTRPHGHH